ncbi:MAG: 2OG-Fe(II) oxygenase [Polaromonas sp.]|uniref:2OG-Fe(II) oxygenase n=1 Tax=Polaromonas sp. TaxID=1869339 RepID=UPI00273237B9|nr:2OG-Fe(II) oxygenase [Polaromonas sp.]MDP3797360.1 2OG-Fe(II) oxygenase [Polaromonas sp.]
MKQQPASAQPVSRELRAWLLAQSAHGHSRVALFQAMLDAGWQHATACRALRLTPQEQAAFTAPAQPAEGAGMSMDAGDRRVDVLQRLQLPDLVVFGNLLSDDECEALMDAARPRLARSLTVNIKTGGEERNRDRTSQGMFFARGENPLVQRVEARIARLVGWPVDRGEGLQVLRYRQGAQYKPHYDYFDPAEPGTPAILQRGGQRVATLIMYLNEPGQGGATIFPDIGLQVKPRRGAAVFFSYPAANPASLTKHGGEPVKAGEKWIATKWLREREFV